MRSRLLWIIAACVGFSVTVAEAADLRLAPVAVTVTVTSAGGPVDDAYVAIVREDKSWRDPLQETILRRGNVVSWDVPPGRYRAVAGAPGFTTERTDIFVVENAPVSRRIELTALVPASGVLEDDEHHPITHGRIGLVGSFVFDAPEGLSRMAETHLRGNDLATTNDSGRFTFLAHPRAGHLLYAEADGFTPRYLPHTTADDLKRLGRITLSRGAALLIETPKNASWPAPYDRLRLLPAAGDALPEGMTLEGASAIWSRGVPSTTSLDWPSLPAGDYELIADTPRTNLAVPQTLATVSLRAGETKHLSVTPPMTPAPTDSARGTLHVLVAEIGPKNAKLTTTRWANGVETPLRYKATSVSGGVRLDIQGGCGPGSSIVLETIEQIGAVTLSGQETCDATVPASLRPKAFGTIDLAPPTGATLPKYGLARLEPCDRRQLTTRTTPGNFPLKIDDKGRAEFPLVAGCTQPTLFIGEFAPLKLERVSLPPKDRHYFSLSRLEWGASILARVVDDEGHPLDDVRIVAIDAATAAGLRGVESLERAAPLAAGLTRNGGWTKLTALPPSQPLTLGIFAPKRRYPVFSQPYSVAARQQLLLDHLQLPAPAALTVHLDRPENVRGLLISEIEADPGEGSSWPQLASISARLTDSGAQFDELPPGPWRISVRGRVAGGLMTQIGEQTVSIAAAERTSMTIPVRAGVYHGHVLYRGVPVSGELAVVLPRGVRFTAMLTEDGAFTAIVDPPGHYDVELRRWPDPAGMVTLPKVSFDDPETDITIHLPDGSITGIVTDENGKPAANVPVVAKSTRVAGSEITTSEVLSRSRNDGTFTLAGVMGGKWVVEATDRARRSEPVNVTVAENQAAGDVRLTVAELRTVRGQLVNSAGQPLAGALVLIAIPGIQRSGARGDYGQTNERGEFELAVRAQALRSPADFKIRAADGSVTCTRVSLDELLSLVMPPSGAVELRFADPKHKTPAMTLLVAADEASCGLPFASPKQLTADGTIVLLPGLAAGVWRLVEASTPDEVNAATQGRAAMLPSLATFIVEPGARTIVPID